MTTDTTLKLWALPNVPPAPADAVARELAGLDSQVAAFVARYTPTRPFGSPEPPRANSVSGTRPKVALVPLPALTAGGGRTGG